MSESAANTCCSSQTFVPLAHASIYGAANALDEQTTVFVFLSVFEWARNLHVRLSFVSSFSSTREKPTPWRLTVMLDGHACLLMSVRSLWTNLNLSRITRR